jgi:hypothetical protein
MLFLTYPTTMHSMGRTKRSPASGTQAFGEIVHSRNHAAFDHNKNSKLCTHATVLNICAITEGSGWCNVAHQVRLDSACRGAESLHTLLQMYVHLNVYIRNGRMCSQMSTTRSSHGSDIKYEHLQHYDGSNWMHTPGSHYLYILLFRK